jgi:hypothetical protein
MKKLAQGAIGTGSGTLAYTVPTGFRTDVEDVCLANTTSGTLTCALHLVPTGVSVAASNMMFPTVSIAGNTLVQWTGKQTLNAGDFIQAIGSGSGLTMNISGNEYRAGT